MLLAGCAGQVHVRPVSPPADPSAAWIAGTPASGPPIATAPPDTSRANPTPAPASSLREVFPGVRADVAARFVEFDAAISPLCVPDPQAPLFFLEAIACKPDTREHESLVVTPARPSHIHAALLLIGLTPGEPGKWKLENDRLVPIDPTGSRVTIELEWANPAAPGGTPHVEPRDWIISALDETRFGTARVPARPEEHRPAPGWVFAGSRLVTTRYLADGTPIPRDQPPREVYAADEAGTVIGLATFGAELIAWSRTFSPDAHIEQPEWIADFTPPSPTPAPPAPGTPIIVRIRPE